MSLVSFVIGTLILMFAGRMVVVPLTETLLRNGQGVGSPDTTYTLVDVGVMGTLGLLMGAMLHTPFIGISLGTRGWAGMLAFMAASFVASRMFV
jgi:hypothetical protein